MYKIYQNQFWGWVCGQRLNSEFSGFLVVFFFLIAAEFGDSFFITV